MLLASTSTLQSAFWEPGHLSELDEQNFRVIGADAPMTMSAFRLSYVASLSNASLRMPEKLCDFELGFNAGEGELDMGWRETLEGDGKMAQKLGRAV
eukprot:g30688.t1